MGQAVVVSPDWQRQDVIALYGSTDPVGAGIRGSPAFGTRIHDNNFDKFEELLSTCTTDYIHTPCLSSGTDMITFIPSNQYFFIG
jgi:hypothetical protein